MYLRRLLVVALLVAPAVAQARRSVVVEVAPRDWRAEALAAALSADLADDRLQPRAPPACDGPCSDAALRAAGVELVVRATLGPGLAYELRGLWPGAPPPVRGAIALGAPGAHGERIDRVGVAGVLRDRLHRMARVGEREDDAHAAVAGLPAVGTLAGAIAIVLAALAVPIAIGSRRRRRLVARAAALRTLAGVAAVGAVVLAIAALEPANARGALLAAGGIAWGTCAAVTVPVVLPPLVGLGQIEYSELWRLLGGWAVLVAGRAIALAVVYAPVAIAVVYAPALLGDLGDIDDVVWLALALPLALLIARQWVRLAIAVAAEGLDAALIDPTTDAAGWQDAVRGYFVGYLRRNALAIDEDLLDHVRVLPALGDEICVYGGGATDARIAIPRRILELALAPWGRPHDYAAPRVSTLHWTQWNAGLVMATEAGSVIATREQRQPRETTTEGDPSEHAREPLGEPPTLAGIIEPAALDPRRSYRPHDDPAWLDWEGGEDHDGTDAGDRDFLFGALVHAIALIQRHGDRPATIRLALARGRLTARLGRLAARIARVGDAVGDDHTAIRGARHHLAQYLGWEAWQREDLLTARAYAPELEAMSRRVLAERAPPSRPTATAARARTRLGRLAGLVGGAPPARTRWRTLAIAGAIAAVAGAAGLAIVDAVRYHATYVERSRASEIPHGKS